jgi:hypothetical protein
MTPKAKWNGVIGSRGIIRRPAAADKGKGKGDKGLGKGKGKDKGVGKGENKGQDKGKGKDIGKGQDKGKGKNKSKDAFGHLTSIPSELDLQVMRLLSATRGAAREAEEAEEDEAGPEQDDDTTGARPSRRALEVLASAGLFFSRARPRRP